MSSSDTRVQTIWRVLGWISVLFFIGFGIWWYWHLPSPGKGGLWLAVGATLMPIFWDRVGPLGKAFWIAMLFLFLSVEYRAIDKDREEFATSQAHAREEEARSFKKLLDTQQAGVQTILLQQQSDVKGILEQEQQHFERTLTRLVGEHRQVEHDFSTLLDQEHQLFTSQANMLEFLTGKLIPASDPTPFTRPSCGGKPNDTIVFIGDEAHFASGFPHTVLQVNDDQVIKLDKLPSGALVLSIDIRTADGRIILRLDQRGPLIPSNRLFMLRPDASTLIVQDEYGNDLLNARYLNSHAFRINPTTLPVRGQFVKIPMMGGGSCVTGGNTGNTDIVIRF